MANIWKRGADPDHLRRIRLARLRLGTDLATAETPQDRIAQMTPYERAQWLLFRRAA